MGAADEVLEGPPSSAQAKSLCVFSPSPYFRVTVEREDDRGDEIHFHAGGQGVWIARMVRVLGLEPILCAPFGGESGCVLRALVEAEGVALRAIPTRGSSGGELHDRRDGTRRELARARSPVLTRHEQDDLYSTTLVEALDAGVLVLAGPAFDDLLDLDVYPRLARDVASSGGRVVADLSGAALEALEAPLALLKISHEELLASGLASGSDTQGLLAGVDALRRRGIESVLVSRADQPAVACIEGRVCELRAPPLEEADHHGAGDSMTAALAVGLRRGLSIDDTLRLAAAAGALNVTRHGLGSGRRETIERFAERVELRWLD